MHAVFFLFGKKGLVDEFIKWLETRMFYLPFKNLELKEHGFRDKDGKLIKEGVQPIDGVLRYGLFGSYELVFPKEYADIVLNTLSMGNNGYDYYGWKMKARLTALRIALNCKKVPKYDKSEKMLLPEGLRDHISVIPIGVRYDRDFDNNGVKFEGL